ncbi:MAG: hypothetical protein QM752_02090 [Gammaproteobacteria bacterium]
MGRSFGDYSLFRYEQWNNEKKETVHLNVPLKVLIGNYEVEASGYLEEIYEAMKDKWPMDPSENLPDEILS